jgi:hypothetical protein
MLEEDDHIGAMDRVPEMPPQDPPRDRQTDDRGKLTALADAA